jgi:hypothetical protein
MTLIFDTATHYASYFAPLKPRIRFKSLDGEDTYFTFDGFATPGSNTINAIYCDAERAVGETGVFNLLVEDSANIINKDHLRNTKVYLDFGKTSSTLKQFFVGFADIFTIRRPRSYYQEYLIAGPSTRIRAAELFISRRQASDIQAIDDPTINPDPFYNVNNLFEESLTDRKWRPLNKEAIDDLTGWTPDLIDSAVNINFPVVNEPLTPLWDFWDRLSQTAGAVWDIDYNTPDKEKVLLSYNPALHTGIIVKSGDLLARTSDAAEKIAYIKSNFDVEENSSADSGTATRLYTTTISDRQVVASSSGQTGRTSLNNRAIAQQIIIENDQRRITEFAFVLERIGEPASPNDRVNGDFVMDSGDNKPTGKTLATFKIPLSDLTRATKTIFVTDVDVKIRFLEGSNKVWLRLFQRSGNDSTDFPEGKHLGDPIDDPENTVTWHHNNKFNTAQTLYSAEAPGGDYDLKDSLSWSSTNQGPIYAFSVFSNIRRIQARTNQQAAAKLRLKEAVIDSGFLSDPRTISSWLSINLTKRAKARMGIQDVVVRVPNNFIFAPYQWVSFNDGLSDTFQDLRVERARIVVSALPGDPQIGALDMNISLSGLYNSLIGNCECQ